MSGDSPKPSRYILAYAGLLLVDGLLMVLGAVVAVAEFGRRLANVWRAMGW